MSTRIAIFFEGELEQVAPPMDLYQNPVSLRVADFIGNPRINFIDGEDSFAPDGALVVDSVMGRTVFAQNLLTGDRPSAKRFPVVLGVRPEKITLSAEPGEGLIPAAVYSVQPAGSETTIHLKMGQTDVLAKEMGLRNYQVDRQVGLRIDPDKINVFDKTTGRLIKLAVPD